ncbi:MAG: threonylcarbamoyl-AMP synthase [Deltaproteobacteria bacterium]|nr:threonylcarbamoyl-AMP synthase [Deltaproteobacteria bacterium]
MAHSTCLRLVVNKDFPEPRKIQRAVEILERGGVIAYPTDTTYGIGCSIFDKHALDRIYLLKGLKRDHLLSIVVPDLSDIARYALVENEAYRIMKRLLPGPYTFILRATPEVPRVLQSKRKTVGIRVPNHPVTLAAARAFAKPIISTSTTVNHKTLLNADEINLHMGHGLDAIVDADHIDRPPSSVVDLTGPYPVVVREGAGDLSWTAV